jgi:hypothetical protein
MPSLAAGKPAPGRRPTSTRPRQKLAPAPPFHCAPGCLGLKGVTDSVLIQANTGSDGLRGVVAIGASAGGVAALPSLAAGLSLDRQAHPTAESPPCPDGIGSLVSLGGGSFRCRDGHACTRDALLAARNDEVENALWVELRSLQEKAKLARQLADTVDHGLFFQRYISLAGEAERALIVLSQRLAVSDPRRSDLGG